MATNNTYKKDSSLMFIRFLLNNKNLTRIQRLRISKLIGKDYGEIVSVIGKTEIDKPNNSFVFEAMVSEDRPIYEFLHQFSEANALKYTTHIWEKDMETHEYPYNGYDDFKNGEKGYTKYLTNWEDQIKNLDKELWLMVKNFLLNEDPEDYWWGEYKISIGYNKYLKNWMDKHPGEQPFAMPISELPEKYIPKPIERKVMSNFNDIVDLFKQCIEFRDDSLYYYVRKIFKNKNVNKELLATLQGVTFYTDTWKIKEAIRIIEGNMRQETDNFEIRCVSEQGNSSKVLKLEILQVGSFSNRDITDDKITAREKDGTMSKLQVLLKNLCGFSIESKFKRDKEIKPFHINYLITDTNTPPIYEIQPQDCRGFKYILTFNIYNNEKGTNNR